MKSSEQKAYKGIQEIMYNYILSVVSINNGLFIAHISTNILS
ncbi:hypothetical protein OTUT144_1008 [Orientia tsutsugamushi str. UT144]|uniref:Uncharacterized protein n=1 Tax=Orientia tsutsugamushi str. UT144 TaxID=1441384 RepID=A0A0F3RLN6_ORITS|nr:hypothetical protein OTUT144_1008 [Orientia tsutsugamushi str. UT144]